EIVVVLLPGLLVRVPEQVELQFRGHQGGKPAVPGPLDLALQDLAGGLLDRAAVFVADVAEHQRRGLEPGDPPQGPQVRAQPEVVVARRAAGQLIAGERLHLHVARQEVTAGVRAVPRHLVDEEAPGDALAQQPALHVHHRRHDRVDLPRGHELPQRFHGQTAFDRPGHVPRPPPSGPAAPRPTAWVGTLPLRLFVAGAGRSARNAATTGEAVRSRWYTNEKSRERGSRRG